MNYLGEIIDYVNKTNFRGGTLIRFSTKGDGVALAGILRRLKPDDSKMIFDENRTFLGMRREA